MHHVCVVWRGGGLTTWKSRHTSHLMYVSAGTISDYVRGTVAGSTHGRPKDGMVILHRLESPLDPSLQGYGSGSVRRTDAAAHAPNLEFSNMIKAPFQSDVGRAETSVSVMARIYGQAGRLRLGSRWPIACPIYVVRPRRPCSRHCCAVLSLPPAAVQHA